jgi:hypothetical protein
MFSFFRKKKEGDLATDIKVANSIVKLLPRQFDYLVKQISEGIIKNVVRLDKPFANYNKFSLDVPLLNKYEDKQGRFFAIKGIYVHDVNLVKPVEVRLYVTNGILLGYSTPAVKILHPDLEKINADTFSIEYLGEDTYEELKAFLGKDELKLINPADVYEVELEGKIYYKIKDLEDGDFIGVDKNRNIYKITHDPYEIIKLDKPFASVLSSQ